MSTPELRQRLKAHWNEFNRVDALRLELMRKAACKRNDERNALFYIDHGYWPPEPPMLLPSWPPFPEECRDMTCGGRSRRTGQPCKNKDLYTNGRCKWHGGASTGPKTRKGKRMAALNWSSSRRLKMIEVIGL